MYPFTTKATSLLATIWGMGIVTCAAQGLEELSFTNLTKRDGAAPTYVPPNFFTLDLKDAPFKGRDVNEGLGYLWSGSIEFGSGSKGGKKYQSCLRYLPGKTFPGHGPCGCTRIDKNDDCDDKNIDHPLSSSRWLLDGTIYMFNRDIRRISLWVGQIQHHASGKCLAYVPKSSFPTYNGAQSLEPGKLGDFDMVDCGENVQGDDGGDANGRIWALWLTEKGTQTRYIYNINPSTNTFSHRLSLDTDNTQNLSIIPWGATHLWPACANTGFKAKAKIMDRLKGKKVQWKRLYRGIAASPTSDTVYFGCYHEENVWVTLHPPFYRVPKEVGFFPDKNNFEDMGTAIDGEKNSIEKLIDFDWENVAPGNEVPGGLEVEGVPPEEVKEALKGIQYEPEANVKYVGGSLPAFDGQTDAIEREDLRRQKKNLERDKVFRKVWWDSYDGEGDRDNGEFQDAQETWDDDPTDRGNNPFGDRNAIDDPFED
ncbi:hypothetical protein TWF718_008119 [Orbilia javanica]|uniref:Uncharacterized protein n=1 Tax=Orbilia javanica TaxID=47235 RepID=A0AAN8RHF1_9PEZI